MWVFTTDGFFSVVEHNTEPMAVMVKARNRAHLERVVKWVRDEGEGWPHILQDEDFDFIVRTIILKDTWARYLSQRAMEINYTANVKGNIMEATDPELGNAMFEIWELMVRYQREIHPDSARDLTH